MKPISLQNGVILLFICLNNLFLISIHCINNLQKNISSCSNLQYTLKILTKGTIIHLQYLELKDTIYGSFHLCNFDQEKLNILVNLDHVSNMDNLTFLVSALLPKISNKIRHFYITVYMAFLNLATERHSY